MIVGAAGTDKMRAGDFVVGLALVKHLKNCLVNGLRGDSED